jgi:uncharacterized protein YcbX
MSQVHPLGTVVDLWRYPVKSLAPECLDVARFDRGGIVGDRACALFVTSSGHARTQRAYRGKENERLHTMRETHDAIELAATRGVAIDLRDHGPYFDLDPVSIIFDTWLRDGERLVGRNLEPLRYRPNIFARAANDFVRREGDLVDRILAIGDVRLRVTEPIHRCVTPSYDLETGESDPRVLEIIARERGNTMGIYAHVVRAGSVRTHDTIAFASD